MECFEPCRDGYRVVLGAVVDCVDTRVADAAEYIRNRFACQDKGHDSNAQRHDLRVHVLFYLLGRVVPGVVGAPTCDPSFVYGEGLFGSLCCVRVFDLDVEEVARQHRAGQLDRDRDHGLGEELGIRQIDHGVPG